MTSFSIENAQSNIFAWWMVEIEGLRYRWSTYLPSWNPADSGVLQHIKRIMADSPEYGGQTVDPLNGKTSIPQHSFSVQDNDGEICALLAVSNTPDNVTFLTASVAQGDTLVSVDDTTDFDSAGDIYIDKETINYTSKVVTSTSSVVDATTSGTADSDPSASKVRLYDLARDEGNDYWKDSYVTFTSGSNSGQTRKVMQSIGDEITTFGSYYDVDDINRLYFDTSDPLPNNVSVGDGYMISYPPHKMKSSSLPSHDWTGAKVTITADSSTVNIGAVRWVKSWDAATSLMEFYDPLPANVGFSTQFGISHHQFSGCTRGMYKSEDSTHSVLDEHGEEIKVTVQDRAPYMKGRRVWIKEYRRTSTETDCMTRVGLLKDYSLTVDGVSWRFNIAGLMHILSAKVLSEQNKAKVAKLNLWGGNFKLAFSYRIYNDYGFVTLTTEHHTLKSCLEDGDTENMTTTDLFTTTQSLFPRNGGNIKIGKEILRYKERHMSSSLVDGSLQILTLGEVRDNLARNAIEDIKSGAYSPEKFGQQGRGLFASKIGLSDIQKSYVSIEWNNTVDGTPPLPPAINALMEQHNIDDEIVSVLLCDGTVRSDFPQYDELEYSGESGSMPTLPYTVTGDSSGATATIKYDDTTDSLLDVIPLAGEFAPGEGVTASGWTATLVEYRKGDGTELPARNNTMSVLLQMLISTGYGTSKYDTLGPGVGLGLDVDLIDIDSIESLRDLYFATSTIEFVLYKTESFKEWAEKNIFTYLQIFPYETNEGKISFGTLYTEAECQSQDTVASPIGDIDGDHFDITTNLPDWDSGKDPITKVTIQYNKNPADKKFLGSMDINFTRSARFYGDIGRTVEIETGCLYLPNELFTDSAPDDPRLPEFFKRVISPLWSRHSSFPVPSIQVMAPYSDRVIEIGDIKKVTHPTLPNMRTGRRGLSGEYAQVLGVQPQPKSGKTALTLILAGVHDSKYGMLSPSAVVYSVALATPSAGQMTVTLYQRNYAPRGQYDRDQFGVDDTVRFVSPAYDDIGASETASDSTIISIGTGSSMTIVMTQPTTPPANGDIMELQDYDHATSTRQGTLCWLAANTRIVGTDGNANKFK